MLQIGSSSLRSGGGSNVIPDPSGRKDRFGNPIYVIKPNQPKSSKSKSKTKG